MIESNVNNQVSAVMRQAQGQDVRSIQAQREQNAAEVAEQASSLPLASSGVAAADTAETRVSSQPSDVVTRLGETTEQVPLYASNRTTGTIIRPAIELAQQAVSPQAAQATPADDQQQAQAVVQEQQQADQAAALSAEPASPAKGRDPSVSDLQQLV